MASTQRNALSAYRRRLKRRGVVRIEVHVRKDDAALVRGVVKALSDPDRTVPSDRKSANQGCCVREDRPLRLPMTKAAVRAMVFR